jgi:hypothetical protein
MIALVLCQQELTGKLAMSVPTPSCWSIACCYACPAEAEKEKALAAIDRVPILSNLKSFGSTFEDSTNLFSDTQGSFACVLKRATPVFNFRGPCAIEAANNDLFGIGGDYQIRVMCNDDDLAGLLSCPKVFD